MEYNMEYTYKGACCEELAACAEACCLSVKLSDDLMSVIIRPAKLAADDTPDNREFFTELMDCALKEFRRIWHEAEIEKESEDKEALTGVYTIKI